MKSCQGRLWLQASRKGGNRLARWYEGMGMIRIDPVAFPKLPGFGDGRKNDGSYFFLDEKSAEAAFDEFSRFRVQL